MTAGRRGYLASEPDNAKGEADFVALVFRTGWVFEVLGIMIAGMGLYKIIENVVFVGPKYSRLNPKAYLADLKRWICVRFFALGVGTPKSTFSGEALVSGGFPDCLSESSWI